MTIGERIREYRQRRGMTLEELGSAVGVTRQGVCRYELGVVKDIPISRIESIAKVLNVNPATLCGWD